MAEDQGASGAPNDTSGASSGSAKDTVSYDTYRKAIGEVKKLKEVLDSVAKEKEEQSNAALIEQNKFKELAESKMKENEELKKKFQQTQKSFVEQNLKQIVARYAKELGAKEEAVDEIFAVGSAKEYWKSIEVKDDYSIDGDQVKKQLEEMSQKSPWFFTKQANPPKDVVMGSKQPSSGDQFNADKLGSLKQDDLKKLLALKLAKK